MTLETKAKLILATYAAVVVLFFTALYLMIASVDFKQVIIDAGIDIKEIAHEIETHNTTGQ